MVVVLNFLKQKLERTNTCSDQNFKICLCRIFWLLQADISKFSKNPIINQTIPQLPQTDIYSKTALVENQVCVSTLILAAAVFRFHLT